jgi:hypothetical protein
MRALNLALRFILEMVVLVALLIWGFGASDQLILQLLLGLGAPAVAMITWGTLISPKAPRRLDDPMRVGLEIVVFSAGALALVAAGLVIPGALLAVASGISLVLMFAWDQRGR